MNKQQIQIQIRKDSEYSSVEENLTDTSLLNTMGWNNYTHGFRVKDLENEPDYILVQTEVVESIYRVYKGHTVKTMSDWINVLVKKSEKWEKKVLSSSLGGMTPITAKKQKHTTLIKPTTYQDQFMKIDIDSSSDNEDTYTKKTCLQRKVTVQNISFFCWASLDLLTMIHPKYLAPVSQDECNL